MSTTTWPEVPTLAFSRSWNVSTKNFGGSSPKSTGTWVVAPQRRPRFDLYEGGLVGLIQEADGLGRSISSSFVDAR